VKIAILMKDYAAGSYSFDMIMLEIKRRLLSRCESSVDGSTMEITRPDFVVISADIWLSADKESNFDIRRKLTDEIHNFIDPLRNLREIGELPSVNRFKTMLNVGREGYVVKHFSLTAAFNGREYEISELPPTPFMVGINGTHKIHVL
jgi:hypothetical protein